MGKMRKVVMLILSMIMVTAMFAFVGCNKQEETPPTTYEVKFVDWDETVLKTEQVISGKDATAPENPSREGYVFSKWSCSFTKIAANLIVKAEYTIIIVDSVAPVITVFEKTGSEIDLGQIIAGQELLLPAVKAIDAVDGDVTKSFRVFSSGMNTALTQVETGVNGVIYKFMSNGIGTFQVVYRVKDAAEKQSSVLFTIEVIAVTSDTAMTPEENQLANLNTVGGIFKENFAKGEANVLVGDDLNPAHMSYASTANAISGTSLVLKYSGTPPMTLLTSVNGFINKFGVYRIRLAAKLLSGEADNGFYVSLANADASYTIDQTFELGIGFTATGAGSTIYYDEYFNYKPTIDHAAADGLNLRFFTMNPDSIMEIALDDLEITYLPLSESDAAANLIAVGSKTWNQEVNPLRVGYGNAIATPSELAGQEGFSGKVLYLNNPLGYSLKFIDTNCLFVAGKIYKISFNYAIEVGSKTNLGIFRGDTGLGGLPSLSMDNINTFAVKKYEAQFTAGDKDSLSEFWIHTGGKAFKGYLGDFTISLVPVTQESLIKTGSYTWHHTDNFENNLSVSTNVASMIDCPDVLKEGQVATGAPLAGFSNRVVHLKNETAGDISSFQFTATNGLFQAGVTYSIQFTYYSVAGDGWLYNGFAGAGATGFEKFPQLIAGKGVHKQDVAFTAKESDAEFMIYMAGHHFEGYLGDFTIKVAYGENDLIKDGTHSYNWTDDSFSITRGEIIDAPDAVKEGAALKPGFSNKVIRLKRGADAGGDFGFSGLGGMFKLGEKYTISFNYYVAERAKDLSSGFSKNSQNPENPLTAAKGTIGTSSQTFTYSEDKLFYVYTDGWNCDIMIGDITITHVVA